MKTDSRMVPDGQYSSKAVCTLNYLELTRSLWRKTIDKISKRTLSFVSVCMARKGAGVAGSPSWMCDTRITFLFVK